MFSRRKKNYRTFVIAALIVALCILIIALLWPQSPEPATVEDVNVNADSRTDEQTPTESKDDEEIRQQIENTDNAQKDDQGTSTEVEASSYYMVKKKGDVISVFFIDEKGSMVKLEDTQIIYELLPLEDQVLFEKGMVIESQEQLASLLQDFEG